MKRQEGLLPLLAGVSEGEQEASGGFVRVDRRNGSSTPGGRDLQASVFFGCEAMEHGGVLLLQGELAIARFLLSHHRNRKCKDTNEDEEEEEEEEEVREEE
jgi:hypothetical protein